MGADEAMAHKFPLLSKKYNIVTVVIQSIYLLFVLAPMVIGWRDHFRGQYGIFVFFVFASVILTLNVANSLSKTITINESGVQYYSIFHKYKIKWEDVKRVGITPPQPTSAPKFGKYLTSFIYFSTDDQQFDLQTLFLYKINNKLIYVRYEKEIVGILQQYYSHVIDGYDEGAANEIR
jgi:hypothetical protein